MGYTTDFEGQIEISPKMKPEHVAFINAFNGTRRIKRNSKKTEKRPDPIRIAAGLDVGIEGSYFVGADGSFGQEGHQTPDIVDYNQPPEGQPGLWCQWVCAFKDSWGHENADTSVPQEMVLEWDEGEKFYHYTEWLKYLIEHFFKPWGYTLNGQIQWQGEDSDDIGLIVVKNNVVTEHDGEKNFPDFKGSPRPFLIIGMAFEAEAFVSSIQGELKDENDIETATKIIEAHMDHPVDRVLIIDSTTGENAPAVCVNDYNPPLED